MAFCCEKLAHEVGSQRWMGSGWLYPKEMEPTGIIECTGEGEWHVNGCCGGGCYVLHDIKFCPFCGTKLPPQSPAPGQ